MELIYLCYAALVTSLAVLPVVLSAITDSRQALDVQADS